MATPGQRLKRARQELYLGIVGRHTFVTEKAIVATVGVIARANGLETPLSEAEWFINTDFGRRDRGLTFLAVAIAHDAPNIVQYLLDAGADVNAPIHMRQLKYPSALHMAISRYEHLLSLLSARRIDFQITDDQNRTALDLAKDSLDSLEIARSAIHMANSKYIHRLRTLRSAPRIDFLVPYNQNRTAFDLAKHSRDSLKIIRLITDHTQVHRWDAFWTHGFGVFLMLAVLLIGVLLVAYGGSAFSLTGFFSGTGLKAYHGTMLATGKPFALSLVATGVCLVAVLPVLIYASFAAIGKWGPKNWTHLKEASRWGRLASILAVVIAMALVAASASVTWPILLAVAVGVPLLFFVGRWGGGALRSRVANGKTPLVVAENLSDEVEKKDNNSHPIHCAFGAKEAAAHHADVHGGWSAAGLSQDGFFAQTRNEAVAAPAPEENEGFSESKRGSGKDGDQEEWTHTPYH